MNLKAQELRIGNWVINTKTDTPFKIRGKDLYPEYNIDEHWLFEPIPLTPEILEKAGFKLNIHGNYVRMFTRDGGVPNDEVVAELTPFLLRKYSKLQEQKGCTRFGNPYKFTIKKH